MGIDITLLPGMGGDTGSIVTESIQAAEDTVACVGTADLLACFSAIIDFALLAYDVWQTLFPSRPKVGKDSASDDTALFFIPSANPVIALWGVGIRQLEALGIPTSSSGGPGYTAQLNLAHAVLSDLQKQFDSPGAPRLLYQGVVVTGLQLFTWYHLLGFETANPDSNRVAIQNRIQLDLLYTRLVDLDFLDPQTGFPKKPATPPPPPTCPAGQHWDAAAGQCVPDAITVQPSDPDNDEFQDCCDETQIALARIAQMVGAQAPGNPDADCCVKVIQAIEGVNLAINNIARLLVRSQQAPPPTPIDLVPVVDALRTLVEAVNHFANETTVTGREVHRDLEGIATAIANAPPTDVSGIVDQLQALAAEGDVSAKLIDYLNSAGYNTAALTAVLQAVNTAPPFAAAAAAAPPPPPVTGIKWIDALIAAITTSPWNAWLFLLSTAGITWTGTAYSFAGLPNTIAGLVDSLVTTALNAGAVPLEAPIRGVIDAVVAQLRPAHAVAIGDSGVDPDLLLAKTLAPALIVNSVMLVADYLGWEISEQLKEYVDWIAELAGLAEVKEVLVGQLMQAGPIAAARLQARRQFRQTIPGAGALAGWTSRGLITQGAALPLMQFNGLHDELSTLYFEAAYSGIAPRQLLRLMNTGLFTDADITDELNFAGIRPASQHRFLLAAPYLATATFRGQLRAEIEKAALAGLLDDTEVATALDSAEQNTDRDSLVIQRLRYAKQIEIVKALETEYITGYVAGVVTQPAFETQVRGLPLQPWKADTTIGIAEARRNATLFKRDEAAARALERATAAAERRTAMQSYEAGFTNEAILTAALLTTGLTAPEAAAWVALAALKKQGNVRWLYGMQLTPEKATILRQRVAALTDQRKHALLTDPQYTDALKALHLPDSWINALRATANATLSPAKARTLTAVQTT